MAVKQLGIVGTGLMGSGVAEVAAKAGIEVILRSRTADAAGASYAGLQKSLARQVDRGKIDASTAEDVAARVRAVTDLDELASCDLVLESDRRGPRHQAGALRAARPDLCARGDPRQQHVHAPDRRARDGHEPARARLRVALLQSRAGHVARRDRTCAHHVGRDDAEVRAFVETCGKTGVEVKDQAGFVVNALLFPYLNNAVKLFDAGVASRDDIDAAMKGGCNFPMGPLELLDLVGLDTSVSILDALYLEFSDPNFAPALLLRRMVAANRLGRKNGIGFYDYAK